MRPDLLGVIEAAYRVEQDETPWLRGVLDAAAPLLDQGMGCSAWLYDAGDVENLRIWSFLTDREQADDRIARAIERSSPNRVEWVFRTQACRTASDGPDWENQPAARLFRTWGIADVMFVNGLDPTGVGCFLTAKLPEVRRMPAPMRRRWSYVATHLAAGFRLRRRLAATSASLDAAAAVLSPRGRLEHADVEAATGTAREALRTAVGVIERARGKRRHVDPDGAIESWKGLVAARWSLVDQFDSDGKRYVVARRNDPDTSSPRALSPRERQAVAYARMGHTNKLIAYELGVSASTVGVLLWRAASKLGARSREELIAAFDRIAAEDDAGQAG